VEIGDDAGSVVLAGPRFTLQENAPITWNNQSNFPTTVIQGSNVALGGTLSSWLHMTHVSARIYNRTTGARVRTSETSITPTYSFNLTNSSVSRHLGVSALSPGQYRFEMRASNAWQSNQLVRSVDFSVVAPFNAFDGWITTNGARVRASANTNANVLRTHNRNVQVRVIGQTTGTVVSGSNVWYQLQGGGYIHSSLVSRTRLSDAPPPTQEPPTQAPPGGGDHFGVRFPGTAQIIRPSRPLDWAAGSATTGAQTAAMTVPQGERPVMPIAGAGITRENGIGFCNSFPNYSRGGFHGGRDIATPRGTPILSVHRGRVVEMGQLRNASGAFRSFGIYIAIESRVHRNGQWGTYRALYAHLDGFASGLSVGSYVQRGQVIGFSGNTGAPNSTGHLHFEVRTPNFPSRNAQRVVDPRIFLG